VDLLCAIPAFWPPDRSRAILPSDDGHFRQNTLAFSPMRWIAPPNNHEASATLEKRLWDTAEEPYAILGSSRNSTSAPPMSASSARRRAISEYIGP
jgi:hypothetical protein